MLHSCPTLISKPLISHLPIICLLPHHRPLLLAVLLRLLPPFPLTVSGFFNGVLEVFEPGALNYFTFSRLILSTLSAFRNPILTHLPLSGFLDSLLCALIAPAPGLAFSLLMTRTLAAVLSFSPGRTYPFLKFIPLSSLDPYSNYVGINIFLNNSSSLSFLNVYTPLPILSSPTEGRTNSFSPSRNLFILGYFNCHHPPLGLKEVRYFQSPWEGSIRLGHLLWPPLNDPDTPTHLNRSSSDISFALSSFSLSCSWKVLQDLVLIIYQFFYPSLSRPNERPLPSTFRKLAGITLTRTVHLQRNTRLFPLLLLSLPLWH